MLNKIILLTTLFAYSIIVSQSFMYILALKHVQLNLGPGSYTELRKLIDSSMHRTFKYVIYATLLANLILVIVTGKYPGSVQFISFTIAFVALLTDTWLAVKGNLPVNAIINTWTSDRYPADWVDYREKWLRIFKYRQIANITGFVSLLIGAVFG